MLTLFGSEQTFLCLHTTFGDKNLIYSLSVLLFYFMTDHTEQEEQVNQTNDRLQISAFWFSAM